MKKHKLVSLLLLCLSALISIYIRDQKEPVLVAYDDILNEETTKIDPTKPMVALTFDDGPSLQYTPMILDTLKQYHAKATFFILGSNIKKAPELLERMQLEGHEIGNHTYSHKLMPSLSESRIIEEITKTNEAIYEVTKTYPSLIRTPYGSYNDTVMKHIDEMRFVKWNVDTQDWLSKDTKKVVNKVLKEVKNKDIILFHDSYKSTAEAIAILVPILIEEGYQLVSVSELYSFE